MKKAPPVRLSLRKLVVAMLAVGPLAILPSPVIAALPVVTGGGSSGPISTDRTLASPNTIIQIAGTGTLTSPSAASTANISVSDRSILVWTPGSFNIAAGERYNFEVSNGSVLNKVGYNATTGAPGFNGTVSTDSATINGTLWSNGRVFVLANGAINVGAGASIQTTNGLYLSTLQETGDSSFLASGNLSYSGASLGAITIGGTAAGAAAVNATGTLSAYSGSIGVGNLTVQGDLILNQSKSASGAGLSLAGVAGPTGVTGNLTVVTNNGAVGQTSALTVSGNTSFTTGTGDINLGTIAGNDFSTVTISSTGSASLRDASAITLGASTAGNLTVTAVNNITTSGAVAVTNNVTLTTTGSPGEIVFATGSSLGGTFNATTSSGNITANVTGNLTTGNIRTGSSGVSLVASISSGGSGYTSAPSVTIAAPPAGGVQAQATAVVSGGVVTGITVTNSGSGYTSAPSVTFGTIGGTAPTTVATATAIPISTTLNYTVGATVPVTSGGSGYTSGGGYTVSFVGGGSTTSATATPVFDATGTVLTGIVINSVGAGYSAAPTVTLTGGPAPITPSASPTINLTATSLPSSATVTSGGTGYTAAPSVSFATTGGGTATLGTASLTSGAISAVAVTNAGSGFTASPTVTFSLTGGTRPNTIASAASALSTFGSGNVALTATGNVLITGVMSPVKDVTISGLTINSTSSGSIGNSTGTTPGTANVVTLTATGGNVTLPSITANSLTVNASGGSITQGAGILTLGSSVANATATLNATGNILLDNLNSMTNLTVTAGGNTVNLTNIGKDTTIANATVAGGLTILTGNAAGTGAAAGSSGLGAVKLGTGGGTARSNITVGGNLTIVTNNALVTDDNGAFQQIGGSVNVTAGLASAVVSAGNVTFNAASAGEGGTGRYGQFNVIGNRVNIQENTSLNLGTITANNLTTNSTAGDVLINGVTTVAGATSMRASSGGIIEGSSGSVLLSGASTWNTSNSFGTNLSTTTNSFGSLVTIQNGGTNIIVSGSNINFTPGNVTSGSVTINTVNVATGTVTLNGVNNFNSNDLRINSVGPIIIAGSNTDRPLIRNLTLNTTDTSATSISQSWPVTVNGTMTITSAGGVALSNVTNNITGNVILNNVAGNAEIVSSRNLTISGNVVGTLTAVAGTGNSAQPSSFSNPWNLILGNLNVGALNAAALNGFPLTAGTTPFSVGAGNVTSSEGFSGNITQASNARLHSDNAATFVTYGGNIVVGNNGNSAGRVSFFTTGNLSTSPASLIQGNVTYVEDPTVRVGSIVTSGGVTITSRFGSILEDSIGTMFNDNGGLALNAPNGSIALGGLTNGGLTTGPNLSSVTINTTGSAAIASSTNLTLGATAANSLTVTANSIAQSAPLNIFGLSTFNATNSIALTDSGNNFGPVAINVTNPTFNATVSVTEASTLNLRTVNVAAGSGNIALTSLNGDIIDTGLGGVRLGGNATSTGTGIVNLAAASGNIVIDDPTSDINTTSGVVFNANNVTLSVLGSNVSTLFLGNATQTANAAGNLTVSSALGNIQSLGRVTSGGTAYFQASNPGAGQITVVNGGFALLKFYGQRVTITESGNMDIVTGSASFGPADLTSGGSIGITNVGGGLVTFGSTVNLTASGNITLPKLVQSVGLMRLSHTGTANLSLLSITQDLGGVTPVDLGTGPYVPPGQ
jgi:hypothetical protein